MAGIDHAARVRERTGPLLRAESWREQLQAWRPAFLLEEVDPKDVHLPMLLTVFPREILTGYMPRCRAAFEAHRSGASRWLSPEVTPTGCLHLLAIAQTHGFLARAGFAPLRAPGRWARLHLPLRSLSVREAPEISPKAVDRALAPVSQLSELTGLSPAAVRFSARILAADGAVLFLPEDDALVASDGFASSERQRRHRLVP